MKELAVV